MRSARRAPSRPLRAPDGPAQKRATAAIQSARNGRSGLEGVAVDDERGHGDEEQRRPERVGGEAAGERPHRADGDDRAERYAAWNGTSLTSPKIAIRAASVQAFSGGCGWPRRSITSPRKTSLEVQRMQRIDLGVGGLRDVGVVVALNGLIQKRKADQENKRERNPQPALRLSTPASIAAPACARRSLRRRGWCACHAARS